MLCTDRFEALSREFNEAIERHLVFLQCFGVQMHEL